jgi:hypothetical protein
LLLLFLITALFYYAAGPDPGGGAGELRLPDPEAAGQPGPIRDLRGESQLHLLLHQSHPLHGHRLQTGQLSSYFFFYFSVIFSRLRKRISQPCSAVVKNMVMGGGEGSRERGYHWKTLLVVEGLIKGICS